MGKNQDPGSWIRDKHGSATLIQSKVFRTKNVNLSNQL
jgi:hypothetical protein